MLLPYGILFALLSIPFLVLRRLKYLTFGKILTGFAKECDFNELRLMLRQSAFNFYMAKTFLLLKWKRRSPVFPLNLSNEHTSTYYVVSGDGKNSELFRWHITVAPVQTRNSHCKQIGASAVVVNSNQMQIYIALYIASKSEALGLGLDQNRLR